MKAHEFKGKDKDSPAFRWAEKQRKLAAIAHEKFMNAIADNPAALQALDELRKLGIKLR